MCGFAQAEDPRLRAARWKEVFGEDGGEITATRETAPLAHDADNRPAGSQRYLAHGREGHDLQRTAIKENATIVAIDDTPIA